MSERSIHITDQDMKRLRGLLWGVVDVFGMDRPYLETLRTELDRAEIVPREEIDPDVVTMNSTVRVRERDGGSAMTVTIVFPEDADPQAERISVLAPLGAALLGYRVGSHVSFSVPSGSRTCEIEQVLYQPEAAGHLHL